MSQQEPTASQPQVTNVAGSQPQPQDEPKVLSGGNMDPTNPIPGVENPEAQQKAEDMGATIPSQGPPPEVTGGDEGTTTASGTQPSSQAGPTETAADPTTQSGGSQVPGSQVPGSQSAA